jgi:hypothetical protein
MELRIIENLSSFPHLLWDTAFPVEELTENKPYRNVGDLLVKRCPTNRRALRLCGCDRAVLEGTASDYECFSALCTATPMLTGHRSAELTAELLFAVFGLEAPLSPYQTDELWSLLNQAIEEADLRPSDVARALNIESVCYHHPALSPLPETNDPGVDLYPIFDLEDGVSALLSPFFGERGLTDTMAILSQHLDTFIKAGCLSARFVLPRHYAFSRNSRKKEIDDLLGRGRRDNNLSFDEQNQLITALLIALADELSRRNVSLLLATEAAEEQLIALYDYLSLNGIVPETVLLTDSPKAYSAFFDRHTVRTDKGLPSLLPVPQSLATYATCYPIGAAILPCGEVSDVLSLADGMYQRRRIASVLASLPSDPDALVSLSEDIAYANIKNRFSI